MVDVTSLSVTVDLVVGVAPAEVWPALTDVTRTARWSPECVAVNWAEGCRKAVPGARFHGRNRAGDWEWDVTCVITEVRPEMSISWVVLGSSADPDRPSSTWRYDVVPRPDGGTMITQSFRHGPGGSHLVTAMASNPEHAEALVEFRRAALRHNISSTLSRMAEDMRWPVLDSPAVR